MEIQPRKFGDALNEWFRSIGRNWKPLLLSSLIVHIPLALMLIAVFWLTGADEAFALYLDPEAFEAMSDAEIMEQFAPFLWVMGLWALLQVIAGLFVYLAAARTVAGDMAGTPFSAAQVSRFAASRTVVAAASIFLVLVGVTVISGLAGLIGWAVISAGGTSFLTVFVTATVALTALVVIIRLGVSLSLGTDVIAIEGAGPVGALRRSSSLIQGRWWVTLGFLLMAALIGSAASQVLSLVLVPLLLIGAVIPELLAVAFGASAILQGPLVAAIGAAYAIWYVDLRAREEALVAEQLI